MTLRPLALALALTVAAAAIAPGHAAETPKAAAVDQAKAAKLTALYGQYWEEVLKLNPVQATFQGDNRYNDQLPDFGTAQYRQESHDFTVRWLKTVQDIGPAGLQGQDLLSYETFVRDSKMSLESEQFPDWMMPINQMGSMASFAVQMGSGTGPQPFKTVKDYDNWLARGSKLPGLFDTAIDNMRQGMKAGVVQPKALMIKVIPQFDALIKDKPEETLFWGPITNLPKDFSDADKQRLTAAYREMIGTRLMPAYKKLRAFINDEYLPATRDSVGLDKLPNGQAWYAFNARQRTTTDLSPAQIHQIGLDEVARIHGEIRKVMTQVGFKGSLQDFFKFMQTDPRFGFKSEDALLAHYRALEAKINQKIPQQFSLVPKAPFEIRAVEPFRAQSAAGGEYRSPSEDGSRPGVFYVNTYDLPTRKTWDAEDLYLHEAIPGHHFQLALQQELTGIPAFRRFGGETAFIEGWGLYAESLGKDLGVYTDPYDYFGYLQNELWRAIRLVTDTGLHSKGWTREQVIKYMLDNSAESETQSTAEAERYIAWPGQALAYKIGELKIQELRRKAEKELGTKFDVREFHAEVLKDGSVPLEVLQQKVDRWIASKKG
ncbi:MULTISPECIES: DUF885 family protein [unclassified Lysobacter]|uniref:DUF885 domain-containing protein n=1 Tax=unclassified Lysobacter TaxID=2635362 RepID=UPI0006F3BC49|nr:MULTISPECIES: DUF885 family protein [unclassified Lysobacter]KQZ59923.1 hypothetical protein ASD53_01735 [Lysobacter sp. Root559]KRC38371.1 hypothetical protein ASE10_02080 [Lysobacter sp. Root76]KRD71509.1 hypothetical protein ASE45_06795 [Lysobacter sp. Root96]